jgi:hypothetical protein
MLNQDTIREAARLTQAGQLAEATALLQRMLRGKRAPDATSRSPEHVSVPGREPPTIDHQRYLQQCGGKPQLQALHPERLSGSTASAGRDASRLHPVAG